MDLSNLEKLAASQYGYLTTRGRHTGHGHTVEIWFALDPARRTVYILAGGRERADWVRNLKSDPSATFRMEHDVFSGTGRIVEEAEEDLRARELVVEKYYNRAYNPEGGWEAQSLPVAIDLAEQQKQSK
jgi:deazaflavin-dependent oxidoreductase (nitroreductase family)